MADASGDQSATAEEPPLSPKRRLQARESDSDVLTSEVASSSSKRPRAAEEPVPGIDRDWQSEAREVAKQWDPDSHISCGICAEGFLVSDMKNAGSKLSPRLVCTPDYNSEKNLQFAARAKHASAQLASMKKKPRGQVQ